MSARGKEKGQVFSLDFLLSIALTLMTIGLVVKATEIAWYDQKDEQLFTELKTVSENAAAVLGGNPAAGCTLERLDIQLMNCIDTKKISPMTGEDTRTMLGIPETYGFLLTSSNPQFPEKNLGAQGEKDFAEAETTALLHSGDVTKNEYNGAFRDEQAVKVRVRVWRE